MFKEKMKTKLKLLTLAIPLVLTGCGNTLVNKVKNAPSEYYNTYTNEQLLSNKGFCVTTTWSEIKDANGRELVQATCDMKSPESDVQKMVDAYHNDYISQYNSEGDQIKKEISNLKDTITTVSKIKTINDLHNVTKFDPNNFLDCGNANSASSDFILLGYNTIPSDLKGLTKNEAIRKTASKCITNLNQEISEKNKSLANFKEQEKRYSASATQLANNLIKVMPQKSKLIAQWSTISNGKQVVLDGLSLKEKSADGKTYSYNLDDPNKVFKQSTNPTMSPLATINYITNQSNLALAVATNRAFQRIEQMNNY